MTEADLNSYTTAAPTKQLQINSVARRLATFGAKDAFQCDFTLILAFRSETCLQLARDEHETARMTEADLNAYTTAALTKQLHLRL